jgi:hypothetical protein
VRVNVLHDIGTVQTGAPRPTALGFGKEPVLSVYVIERLDVLSVALAGDGAAGACEPAGLTRAVGCLPAIVCFDGTAEAKVSIVRETLARQRKTPSRLRVLMKPDLEEDCFFIFNYFRFDDCGD